MLPSPLSTREKGFLNLVQCANEGVGHGGGGSVAAEIAGANLAGAEDFLHRAPDACGSCLLVRAGEKIDRGQEQRQWIGAIDADTLTARPVEAFVAAHAFADVDARRRADAADHAGAQI